MLRRGPLFLGVLGLGWLIFIRVLWCGSGWVCNGLGAGLGGVAGFVKLGHPLRFVLHSYLASVYLSS